MCRNLELHRRKYCELSQMVDDGTAMEGAERDSRIIQLAKGVSVSITPRNEYEVLISERWLDRAASALTRKDGRRANPPSEDSAPDRSELAAALRGQILTRVSSLRVRYKTRGQLRASVSRLRTAVANGELPEVCESLRLELCDLEHRRRSAAPHGKPPPTLSREDVEYLRRLSREVHDYVEACCRDPAMLRKLADDVLDFLRSCPESTEEWLASKSAHDPAKEWAVLWSFGYWTSHLRRSPSDMKPLVAFTEVILQMNGFELDPAAIRKQLERVPERYQLRP
jgi:hypothetical protein